MGPTAVATAAIIVTTVIIVTTAIIVTIEITVTTAIIATTALAISPALIREIVATTSKTVEMITIPGAATEAAVVRTEKEIYPKMTGGKNHQKNHVNRIAGAILRITKGMKAVAAAAAADGMIDEIMKTIGHYHCLEMSVWSRICSVREILESISINTKIYLLKQPGIRSRAILHL